MKTIDVTNSASLKDLVTLATKEHEIVLTQDSHPVARVLPITPGESGVFHDVVNFPFKAPLDL